MFKYYFVAIAIKSFKICQIQCLTNYFSLIIFTKQKQDTTFNYSRCVSWSISFSFFSTPASFYRLLPIFFHFIHLFCCVFFVTEGYGIASGVYFL